MTYSGNANTMLFKQFTTYQDYGNTENTMEIETWNRKKLEKPKLVKEIVYEPLKHTEIMRPYKNPLSFNLYHQVKGKEGASPQKITTKQDLQECNKEEIIRTRPRVIITPQVTFDDISDPKIRENFIKQTYISSAHKDACQWKTDDNIAPLVEKPAIANPIFLPPFREPKVSPEWRMESMQWDGRQLRGFVNPDREFWKHRNLYENCIPCKETAQIAQIKIMKRRLNK